MLMVVLFFSPVITFNSEWKIVLNVSSKIAWRKKDTFEEPILI